MLPRTNPGTVISGAEWLAHRGSVGKVAYGEMTILGPDGEPRIIERRFVVDDSVAGQRLDQFLKGRIPRLSRMWQRSPSPSHSHSSPSRVARSAAPSRACAAPSSSTSSASRSASHGVALSRSIIARAVSAQRRASA